MSWQKVYGSSKKVHRVSMWGVVVFGLIQLVTGLILKWPVLGGNDRELIRSALTVHGGVAGLTAMFLLLQITTGILMWLAPKMVARRVEK